MRYTEPGECPCPYCGEQTQFPAVELEPGIRTFGVFCSACDRMGVCLVMVMFSYDIAVSLTTVESLRLSVQQDSNPAYCTRQALEVLQEHPLAEGDLYPGDLLSAVLTRSPELWRTSPELAQDLRAIVSALVELPPRVRRESEQFLALQE